MGEDLWISGGNAAGNVQPAKGQDLKGIVPADAAIKFRGLLKRINKGVQQLN